MFEISYTPLAGKIETYFKKIEEVRVPEKADIKWFGTLGFKNGNDAYILRVLKYIGFIDSSSAPTDIWRQFKDPSKSKIVLAQAIRNGYKELFDTYSDANRKDREALYAFFSAKTGLAKNTVDLIVNTFVNLSKLADFETELLNAKLPTKEPDIPQTPEPILTKQAKGIISEMHINIQLHLPPTSDSTVYDALFKSLKKYLLSDEE
jgi:hypothetical protein